MNLDVSDPPHHPSRIAFRTHQHESGVVKAIQEERDVTCQTGVRPTLDSPGKIVVEADDDERYPATGRWLTWLGILCPCPGTSGRKTHLALMPSLGTSIVSIPRRSRPAGSRLSPPRHDAGAPLGETLDG